MTPRKGQRRHHQSVFAAASISTSAISYRVATALLRISCLVNDRGRFAKACSKRELFGRSFPKSLHRRSPATPEDASCGVKFHEDYDCESPLRACFDTVDPHSRGPTRYWANDSAPLQG